MRPPPPTRYTTIIYIPPILVSWLTGRSSVVQSVSHQEGTSTLRRFHQSPFLYFVDPPSWNCLQLAPPREEERANSYNPSMLRALRLFLKRVENISNMKITFYDLYYKQRDVPPRVLAQSPLILDPSSPWNNYLYKFGKPEQQFFSTSARNTLQRLERVETQCVHNHGYPDFKGLFLPQPTMVGPQQGLPIASNWMVGSPEGTKKTQPNLIIRKRALENEYIFKVIQKAMAAFVYVAELQSKHAGTTVKESVKNCIDDVFGSKMNWSPIVGQSIIRISSNWSVV